MEYKTVKGFGQDEHTIKKSRFIGFCTFVDTQEKALGFISEIKSRHRDARHNASAYRLKSGEVRFSDDGEPQGTAGAPILQVIERQSLENVCIVVTRYFGGILLGAPGLVRAYSTAASLSTTAAGIVVMTLCGVFSMSMDYGLYGKVCALLEELPHKVVSTMFEDNVKLEVAVASKYEERFLGKVTELSFGACVPVEKCKEYFPLSYSEK